VPFLPTFHHLIFEEATSFVSHANAIAHIAISQHLQHLDYFCTNLEDKILEKAYIQYLQLFLVINAFLFLLIIHQSHYNTIPLTSSIFHILFHGKKDSMVAFDLRPWHFLITLEKRNMLLIPTLLTDC